MSIYSPFVLSCVYFKFFTMFTSLPFKNKNIFRAFDIRNTDKLGQSADKLGQNTDQSALKTDTPCQISDTSNQNTCRTGLDPFDNELSKWSDSILYQRCQEYGLHARVWRRRFAGLLPEVLKRNLHRRRGYASIHEFAFKLAGMSSASVDKVLHIYEKVKDKPNLCAQLISGSQGWTKIERVAYLATPQTEKDWAEKVEKMSSQALSAYVEYERKNLVTSSSYVQQEVFTENRNVSLQTVGGLHHNNSQLNQGWGAMTFPVSTEVEKQLRLLKYQLEREKGVTLTFNEVFQILLAQQGNGGQGESTQVVIQLCPECAARKAAEVQQSQGISRPIPAHVRRVIQGMYHGFCAFPTCALPATSLHHTKRFSLERIHDPSTIVPLCKNHERLVHYGLIANEEAPPREWKVLSAPDRKHLKYGIDRKVQNHRKEPVVALSSLQKDSP